MSNDNPYIIASADGVCEARIAASPKSQHSVTLSPSTEALVRKSLEKIKRLGEGDEPSDPMTWDTCLQSMAKEVDNALAIFSAAEGQNTPPGSSMRSAYSWLKELSDDYGVQQSLQLEKFIRCIQDDALTSRVDASPVWRPIVEATKVEMERILLTWNSRDMRTNTGKLGPKIRTGYFSDGKWRVQGVYNPEPTYFMHLPQPPQEEGG